jgi:endonuclease/exonuclease/phosphatase family metal-dependent hydrolase
MKLRVSTWNIHKGVSRELFGLKHHSTIHELRNRLHDLSSDLVFLQEVQGQNDRHAERIKTWPDEPQNVFLARSNQKRHVFETAYGKNASYLHGHHGNALLSKFPIVRKENRDVSDHALEKRGILHCTVRMQRRHVHCFVVHFGLFARSRRRQVEALMNWIDKEVSPNAPLLIAGDFNDWRHLLSKDMYARLGVQEVFDDHKLPTALREKTAGFIHGKLASLGINVPARIRGSLASPIHVARTFPSMLPWLRMDRIYQRGFITHHVSVKTGPSWAALSDHAPLIADLELIGS